MSINLYKRNYSNMSNEKKNIAKIFNEELINHDTNCIRLITQGLFSNCESTYF